MITFLIKYISVRKGRHIFTSLTLILTVVTILLTVNVSDQLTSSIKNTYQYYDTIIGPGGSQTQLLLNTLFYIDKPLGTMSFEIYEALIADDRVSVVIPFASGDSYNNAPIIGTHREFLSDFPGDGRLWADSYEVVLGNNVAKNSGLKIGSSFFSIHGLHASEHMHAGKFYVVVGVLDRTGTALDNAVFCDISTVWLAHSSEDHGYDDLGDHEESIVQSSSGISAGFGVDPFEDMWNLPLPESEIANLSDIAEDFNPSESIENPDKSTATTTNNTGEHSHLEGEITAVLIKCNSMQNQISLASEYNKMVGLQAINPSVVMRGILGNINTATKIALVLCVVIMLMGLIVIINIAMLNMYDMKVDLKLLRLIGISQAKVEGIVYLQTLVVTIISIICSLILSHIMIPLANYILPATGILLSSNFLTFSDLFTSVVVLICNMLPIIVLTKYNLSGGLINEKD